MNDPITRPSRHRREAATGFTLIELMIIVVIVALLTAVALPSYRGYVLRSHRADALATLAQDQAIFERCYAQNYSYVQACAALPAFPQTSPQGLYSVELKNQGATSYRLEATPQGSQTADTACAFFSVDQANDRKAFDTHGTAQPSCWSR